MTNLATANAGTLATLDQRSRVTCVVYANHPLPIGTVPPAGDIGVEQNGGATLLHVRRGFQYRGDDDEVRDWISTGTRSFPSLTECIDWLRQRLPQTVAEPHRATPAVPAVPAAAARPDIERLPVDEVTELDQIQLDPVPGPTADELEAVLSKEVLGQEVAVRGLAELAAYHVSKPYPRRPASALLVGPTGSGKTLGAELLAQHLTGTTGSEWSYERLDMNEFSEKHTASRLFGAPPGYIGYDDGNDLAAALRRNPRTVVVLDEIDKAHPQLWRSLMNLMDAGRLGGQGGDIDARQAILLFTSNKDAAAIQPLADAPDDRLRAFLRDHNYPPEIVARMGRILVFKPLPPDVTARLIVLTVQRIVESYGMKLTHIAPEAVADLAQSAPLRSGGRDVEYFIERELSHALAAIPAGTSTVTISADMSVKVDETISSADVHTDLAV